MIKLVYIKPDESKINGSSVYFLKQIEVGRKMMFTYVTNNGRRNIHRSGVVVSVHGNDECIFVSTDKKVMYIFEEVSNEENK